MGRDTYKLGILASTNGSDIDGLVAAIDSGELDKTEIALVITNRPGAGVIERARDHGLRVDVVDHTNFDDRKTFDEDVSDRLDLAMVDLVLMIGYMRIVTPWFVKHYKGRLINVHPSLLPAFAGGMDKNVHKEVLDYGCKVSGATIHLVTDKPDEGPILWQKAVEIAEDETVETLKEKVQAVEKVGLVEVVKRLKGEESTESLD